MLLTTWLYGSVQKKRHQHMPIGALFLHLTAVFQEKRTAALLAQLFLSNLWQTEYACEQVFIPLLCPATKSKLEAGQVAERVYQLRAESGNEV